MNWDADTYLIVERMLSTIDRAMNDMHGWAFRKQTPPASSMALLGAWNYCIDMAEILNKEKIRLELAKVEYDRGQ